MGQGPSTPLHGIRREDGQRNPGPLDAACPPGAVQTTWTPPTQVAAGSSSAQGNAQPVAGVPAAPPTIPLSTAGGLPAPQPLTMPQLVQAAALLSSHATNAVPPIPSLPQPTAAAAAGAAASTAPTQAAPSNRASHLYKHANLIPVFSKGLSSQALHVDGQRCAHPSGPQTRVVSPLDTYAVLELEVMKFVAYCGGLTIKFCIDEVPTTPQLGAWMPVGCQQVGWGIVSTKACPSLSVDQEERPASTTGAPEAGRPQGAEGSKLVTTFPGARCISQPQSGLPVDNAARKPFYIVAGACSSAQPVHGDILSMEFAPQEAGKPYIKATLMLNSTVLMQQCLPCASISMVQLHPFVTLAPGMAATLYEAATPSPLFTWFPGVGSVIPDFALTELDTCIKFASAPATATQAAAAPAPHMGPQVDFLGSTVFTAGRQRWTVQLDNAGALPSYVFVGVTCCITGAHASASSPMPGGPLRSIASSSTAAAGSSTVQPAVPSTPMLGVVTSSAGIGTGVPGNSRQSLAGPETSSASGLAIRCRTTASGNGAAGAAVAPRASASGTAPSSAITPQPTAPLQWGAWIRLPGAAPAGHLPSGTSPPRDGMAHYTEASSNHCYITIDLDLGGGFMRIFRNGHTIGSTFTGLSGTLCPVVSFVQGASITCQLGLVNITKLQQLELGWAIDRCSADLQLAGPVVSKVSEVYGDYSTVLANEGFTSGVHLWMVKINNLSEPDSIFIGVCRGCMPLDQDPQDLRDRTYYLSNGVIRVGGRRVATNAAQFTKGDIVTVVLDADQGEVVFFRNGMEQGRARGIRGRLFPFVSCDSEGDQVTLVASYTLRLDRIPRQLADMEWDTLNHALDVELSSNCLTATKTTSSLPSTVQGSIVYSGSGVHEFHVILDTIGPDGIWVGVAPPGVDPNQIVGDEGCGWALHSDGDKRYGGREEEYAAPFRNGDVLTVILDLDRGTLSFNRNGLALGEAFHGVFDDVVPAATLASEESKITIQNRPTVLNTGAYVGDLRWDEARAGKDLSVIDGLTVTKMGNDGGDYATVLGSLCLASGQHAWNVYVNHVEDSNLFIGVTVGGHDLNGDPQEMKHRTYYLSNGTIRVAGKLVTRCAEPYAEGDLVQVQLDMDQHKIRFLKNGVVQGAGDGLPEEVWPYISLDNVMDSITLHSSAMFQDLMQSLRWNPNKACRLVALAADGSSAALKAMPGSEETYGQGTVLGLREYSKVETHTWMVRVEQQPGSSPVSNFLVGVAPPTIDLNKSLGEEHCGIGLDYFGYFYVNGRYFHVSSLSNWKDVCKPVRGSTAKHKGKSQPIFLFEDGKCEITLTLDLKEGTLRFAHGGRNIGIITDVQGPLHAAATLTSSRQKACLAPGPMGRSEHTNEELVSILKGKGIHLSVKMEAALLLVPRELFVPRDRHREAFRDQKVTVRTSDGSTMTLPPPSFVATALDKLGVGTTATSFLDVGCGTAYVSALAACLMADRLPLGASSVTLPTGSAVSPGTSAGATMGAASMVVQGIECVNSRLEAGLANMRALKDRLAASTLPAACKVLGDPAAALARVELLLANVLIPECTNGNMYDALFCDVAVNEEELPMLLSLLNPSGKLVCLIEEEAVLITRGQGDTQDYQREVLQQLQGEYGSLQDPTPWEVQEAIRRIKQRERKRGHDQAKQDVASLRSFEYVEMAQRVQAALQRVAELEGLLQRAEQAQHMGQTGHITPITLRSPSAYDHRSLGPVGSVTDDVRIATKDKERRSISLLKASPRGSFVYGSPMPSPGLNDSGDWKAMYTTDGGLISPGPPSKAKQRLHELLLEQDQSQSGAVYPSGGDVDVGLMPEQSQEDDDDEDDVLHVPMESTSPMVPLPFLMGPASQLHMAHQVFENIIDSMSVQTFTPEQIHTMISGSEPVQIENRDVYHSTFKGVRVRVWRVHVSHGVSYLELKRAYNRYCIAHPNIAAVLGVCIQPIPGTSPLACSHAGSLSCIDVKRCASTPAPSPLSKCTYARSLPDASWLASRPGGSSLSAELHNATVGTGSCDDPGDTGIASVAADAQSVFEDESVDDAEGPTSGLGVPFTTSSCFRTPEKQHPSTSASAPAFPQQHVLWVVEESFGDESLHSRLERGMLSWQQACRIATDMCKALAFLQDLKRHSDAGTAETASNFDVNSSPGRDELGPRFSSQQQPAAMLSAYALRTIVTPTNVQVNAQSTKVSVLPTLLHHLEAVAGIPANMPTQPALAPLHCDMAYIDPHSLLCGEASTPSLYAYGIVQLQLLTEQGPLGLLSAVKEAIETGSLMNLIPRLPINPAMAAWANDFAQLALRCTQPPSASTAGSAPSTSLVSLESELLPALEALGSRLGQLGSNAAMSWEQVEEMLMLPLQPRTSCPEASARRWVRQDFRVRRKLFMEEVAKLAVEGPIHKIEVRRGRCFKDSIGVFAGKGHTVWRQPLKVTFLGEQGMDSGGVTREWFSALSSSISRGSPELFWPVGSQRNQLYINPLSSAPSHLKKFHFVGLFMAKAILESSARSKELGPITLNLPFCEPLWKLLLGIPLNLMDLQLLDPTEFRSLMSILDMDIEGLIFETFTWQYHQASAPQVPVSAAGFGVGPGYVQPAQSTSSSNTTPGAVPAPSTAAAAGSSSVNAAALAGSTTPRGPGHSTLHVLSPPSALHTPVDNDASTPTATAGHAHIMPFTSPQGGAGMSSLLEQDNSQQGVSIPLKPGGTHLKVTNHNKREYVLLKAHKMLVGTIEPQMTAIIDAFHSLIPRDLVDKYAFTSMEMQLLVCGEQRIDVQDLQRNCKYEDGYSGKEPIISWFWQVVEGFDDTLRRQLLQFWSGSDGMPAEGFAAMDPAFHMVAVERLYDAADTTARLPAAHTCFRQLDLPRYKSLEELKEKLTTAITIGQGYMALT